MWLIHRVIYINPKMLNRHGLIAGATGTGKTVSLQVRPKPSAMPASLFYGRYEGDLSGVSQAGKPTNS